MESNNKVNEILVIDIELYAKEGKTVPTGCHYIIMIDRQKIHS